MFMKRIYLAVIVACLALPLAVNVAVGQETQAVTVDHVAFYVVDMNASLAFYKGVLGFREVPAPIPVARWLDMGNGVKLHLVAGRTEPVAKTKWVHLAVACADMDAMTKELDAKGVAWSNMEGEKKVQQFRADAVKQIFVRDPDGYWIEINDMARKQ